MSIPATDSLRHERVGLASNEDDSVTMVLKSYVETDETEERGAYDPIEGIARPFPLMVNAQKPTVIESFIEDASFEPFSDALVEYAALLYESMEAEEWVDELIEFDTSRLDGVEERLAASLQHFATRGLPMTLQRTVYRKASRLQEMDDEEDRLISNPLRDIEGREQYEFEYLPKREEVDSWTLTHAEYTSEMDDGQERIASSLWLRYEIGDIAEERPLIAFQNELAGFSASSPNVEFREHMLDEVSASLVEEILSGDDTDAVLTPIDMDALEGTRTEDYLNAFVSND